MKDTELLQFIYKTAVMGIEGLNDVQGHIKDEKLCKAVQQQVEEYQNISDAAGNMLRSVGEEPNPPGRMARLSSEMMSAAKTLMDSSPSKIAEMVIQGNHMGIIQGTRHLHDYAGEDDRVRALAEKLLKTEQANVEQMKPFL